MHAFGVGKFYRMSSRGLFERMILNMTWGSMVRKTELDYADPSDVL
jgi:hypothetical protein